MEKELTSTNQTLTNGETSICPDYYTYSTNVTSGYNYIITENYFVIYYYPLVQELFNPDKIIVGIVENEKIAKDFCSKYSTENIKYLYEKEIIDYD